MIHNAARCSCVIRDELRDDDGAATFGPTGRAEVEAVAGALKVRHTVDANVVNKPVR